MVAQVDYHILLGLLLLMSIVALIIHLAFRCNMTQTCVAVNSALKLLRRCTTGLLLILVISLIRLLEI